jgi:large repetitive protein
MTIGRIQMSKAVLLCATCFAMLAFASSANAATNRFVDRDTGVDNGDCSNSATPCVSIAYAVSQAGAGDTVKVDDSATAYLETVSLQDGVSLTGADFAGGDEGVAILDGGSSIALQVGIGASAGTISGLTLRSTNIALRLLGAATAVTGNTFDSGGADQRDLIIQAGSPTVSQNLFTDGSTTLFDTAIIVDASSPTISNNTLINQNVGISLGSVVPAPATSIVGNTISGTHASGTTTGVGIEINRSVGFLLQGNLIHAADSPSQTTGIRVAAFGLSDSSSGTFRRNQVYGLDTGISISDTSSTTMSGDVIGGSTDVGLFTNDDSNPTGNAAVSAKNVTIAGSGSVDAQPTGTALTLDSSIIGDAGIVPIGVGSCTITRSRGPSAAAASGCGNFATNAVPDFVNAVGDDYRLTGSASNLADLIDHGDPAAPTALDTVDFEGQKRAMDGDGNCTETRDIGADEFLPAAPTASITGGPANGSTITSSSTSFSFTNSNTCIGASFQCKVDGGAFSACTSPVNLNGLAEGGHTFQVRARDLIPQAGVPVSRTFTVDLPAPPPSGPGATPPATAPSTAPKHCKKGRKLKKGKCVKKKHKK